MQNTIIARVLLANTFFIILLPLTEICSVVKDIKQTIELLFQLQLLNLVTKGHQAHRKLFSIIPSLLRLGGNE